MVFGKSLSENVGGGKKIKKKIEIFRVEVALFVGASFRIIGRVD